MSSPESELNKRLSQNPNVRKERPGRVAEQKGFGTGSKNSWDRLLLDKEPATEAALGDHSQEGSGWLAQKIKQLFAQQRETWPLFQQGEASLDAIQKKELCEPKELDEERQSIHGMNHAAAKIVVQFNPGRIASTHAKTDAKSIAARPCFLCPENMPPEERGIAFKELVILPNPFPVLQWHCTIPDRTHRPQHLLGRVERMLQLARAVGPELLVFYNGPKCGASAPDHFHFQACSALEVPLLQEPFFVELAEQQKNADASYTSFGRAMFVFSNCDAQRVQANVEAALEAIETDATDEEPMVNVLAWQNKNLTLCVLIPRSKHRPACYSAEGNKRLAISPAALEMAGVLVATERNHFDRINASNAKQIYEEVCWDEAAFLRHAKHILSE